MERNSSPLFAIAPGESTVPLSELGANLAGLARYLATEFHKKDDRVTRIFAEEMSFILDSLFKVIAEEYNNPRLDLRLDGEHCRIIKIYPCPKEQ
ncbi:hypothetical protein N1030_01525 [Desulfovibrio mangrovi]|uniref:hypothetical protein n=1 Tax=Desulfovibrio mangrovi TaxID=2976983 RepID=UPI002248391B|nr:hypothetical protein [Desulfovibrio mangrovi]UZP67674.1 hypothetical protein N1030_01525 [Desulfovibrio mangrovi]